MKLSKLVKNGAKRLSFLSPFFGQIGYFRGMQIKIGAKKLKNGVKSYFRFETLANVRLKNDLCNYDIFWGEFRSGIPIMSFYDAVAPLYHIFNITSIKKLHIFLFSKAYEP